MRALDAGQIAGQLATALAQGGEEYARALALFWGEGSIEVVHEPPLPMDAPMSVEAMLAERRTLDEAFHALMADFAYVNVHARAIGETVYVFCDQSGTLADGVRVLSPLCSRFTIRDGRIVRVVLNIDPVSVAPLQRAFLERGGAGVDAP